MIDRSLTSCYRPPRLRTPSLRSDGGGPRGGAAIGLRPRRVHQPGRQQGGVGGVVGEARAGGSLRALRIHGGRRVPAQGARGRRVRRVPGRHRVRAARPRTSRTGRARSPSTKQAEAAEQVHAGSRPPPSAKSRPATPRHAAANAEHVNAEPVRRPGGRRPRAACLLAVVAACLLAVAGSGLRGPAAQVERARGARDRQGGARSRRLQVRAARAGAGRDATSSSPSHELDQGDYFRAREHVRIADRNAREAYNLAAALRAQDARAIATTTASSTTSTSARTIPRTRTASRTRTAAPIRTTTRTASSTRRTSARTSPRTRTGSRTRTAAPIRTTTPTASRTRTTSARTSPRTRTGSRTRTAAPIRTTTRTASPTPPTSARTSPGPPDNDGCPKKYEHIVVTQEKIELKQKIFFDTDKATIQPRSFSLLDEIGSVLKSRPTMTVRIEGHTDSRGTRKHNMKLCPRPVRSPCGNI